MTRLLMFVVMVLVAGCAGTPPPENTAPQPQRFLSLSPASLGYSLSLSQLVTGDYAGKQYKMRFELDITPSRLAIVGLSPLGVTLFTIVEENSGLSVETFASGPEVFDPRHMLFDLYLTYWPAKVLQPALSRIRMRLEETTDGTVRRVRELDGKLIAEIDYPEKRMTGGHITIQHFDFPYRLRVETLEAKGAR